VQTPVPHGSASAVSRPAQAPGAGIVPKISVDDWWSQKLGTSSANFPATSA